MALLEVPIEKNKRLTPWEVLRLKFPEAEYVLISEVSDASGFSRSRSLDYMLINLWESRGLAVTGIEQKSNRGDWLKELKNPAKQEKHFKHCDYFYLLTDKDNVAKLDEIPATWGWYHINERQILKTMKSAPKLTPEPVGRSLMCAMLRRAACKKQFVHLDTLDFHIQTEADKLQKIRHNELERDSAAYKDLVEKVEKFEEFSGIKITHTYGKEMEKIGDAIRIIKDGGLDRYAGNLERINDQVKAIYDSTIKRIDTIKEYQAEHGNNIHQ